MFSIVVPVGPVSGPADGFCGLCYHDTLQYLGSSEKDQEENQTNARSSAVAETDGALFMMS